MADVYFNIEPYQRSYFEKTILAHPPVYRPKRRPLWQLLVSQLEAICRQRRHARARRLKALELQNLNKRVAKDHWAEALLKSG